MSSSIQNTDVLSRPDRIVSTSGRGSRSRSSLFLTLFILILGHSVFAQYSGSFVNLPAANQSQIQSDLIIQRPGIYPSAELQFTLDGTNTDYAIALTSTNDNSVLVQQLFNTGSWQWVSTSGTSMVLDTTGKITLFNSIAGTAGIVLDPFGGQITLNGQSVLTNNSSLTVLPNGKVGIGTSSPDDTLTVQGSSSFTGTLLVANLSPQGTVPAIGVPTFTTANSYSFVSASNNLIGGLRPIVNAGSVATYNGLGDGSAFLTNGSVTTYGQSDNVGWVNNNTSLTYTLGNGAYGSGYDVTNINVYTGWGDAGRANINLNNFSYSTVSNPAVFTPIPGTGVAYAPGTGDGYVQISATNGVLATKVYAIRFNFGAQENNGVGYKELEVGGYSETSANNPAAFYVANNGFIGIGSQNPDAHLDIEGAGNILLNSGNVGIGTNEPIATLSVGTVGNTDPVDVASPNGGSFFHITQAGNVGIGTATPVAPLEVKGSAQIDGSVIATGTANLMPNQTLGAGPGSVLTEALADSRYLILGTGSNPAIGTAGCLTANSYNFAPVGNNLIAGLIGICNAGSVTDALTLIGQDGLVDLTDGNVGTYGDTPGAAQISSSTSITYTLGDGVYGFGFDITNINVYSGWSDAGRSEITLSNVSYSTPTNPTTFTPIPGTVIDYAPGTSHGVVKISATNGVLATKVYAIQFNFGQQQNGNVGYKELEAAGYPDANSNPSAGVYVGAGGNLGIGTSNPNAHLDVEGWNNVLFNSGNVGIGTDSPSASLSVVTTTGTDPVDVASSSGSSFFHITQAGNVGIGTATPTASLEVSGTAQIDGGLTVTGTVKVSGTSNVVLINPAGDILMGNFMTGTRPQ